MIDGKRIRPGDVMIGLASSGLHTNGYSLARKIFFEKMKLKPSSRLTGLTGSIGEELLKVHVSYSPLVKRLLSKFNHGKELARRAVKGIAHITGGGFIDNIPRVLPKNCDVLVRKGSWELSPLFEIIRDRGGVPEAELYQVFNMGIGLTLIVAAASAEAVRATAKEHGHKSWIIGEVVKGSGIAKVI
jgi:phosphoribosylformylglycinamidine cyclo-ligase